MSETNKESCRYVVNIVIDYSLVQTVESVTRNNCQSSRSEKTREVPKIAFQTENNHGIPNGIKMGEVFLFKTPSSILIVGPSGCGKTCFTKCLLLDQLEELFVNPPPTIQYCYEAWQDRFKDMQDAGVQYEIEIDHILVLSFELKQFAS